MRRVLLLLLVLGLAPLGARADGETNSSAPAPVTDVAAVRAHYREVVARPPFQEAARPSDAFPFRDWISQWLTRLVSQFQDFKYAGRMSGLAGLLVTTMAALALVGLGYVLMRLSRRRRDPQEGEDGSPAAGPSFLAPEVYEERLRQAVERRDWHGAWLATWLQFLARLEARRLVEADRSRTNREYLAQLRERQLPASALPLLAGLVDDYDRFVYGLRVIDEPGWRAFRGQVDEAGLLLHLSERPSAGSKEAA